MLYRNDTYAVEAIQVLTEVGWSIPAIVKFLNEINAELPPGFIVSKWTEGVVRALRRSRGMVKGKRSRK